MKRKIFDCFLFWKEFNALEIRLHELYDVVDKFIIVEFAQSHSGRLKPFYLAENLHSLKMFEDKLKIFSLDVSFKDKSELFIAHSQRRILDQIIFSESKNPDDLIITSDSDEIIRGTILQEYKSSKVQNFDLVFELNMYHNYLNNFMGTWLRPRLKSRATFKGFSYSYRDIFLFSNYKHRRFKSWPFMRVDPFFSASSFDRSLGTWVGLKQPMLRVQKNAGWHFTKLYPLEDNYEHALDSPHQESARAGITLLEMEERISKLRTSYGPIAEGVAVEIDSTFPSYLVSNPTKFNEYILKREVNLD